MDKVWSKCKDIAEIFRETSDITGIPLKSVRGEFGKKKACILDTVKMISKRILNDRCQRFNTPSEYWIDPKIIDIAIDRLD